MIEIIELPLDSEKFESFYNDFNFDINNELTLVIKVTYSLDNTFNVFQIEIKTFSLLEIKNISLNTETRNKMENYFDQDIEEELQELIYKNFAKNRNRKLIYSSLDELVFYN